MDENKFTPTAEEALQLAQEAAGELGHGYMGTEHLLLGLMREDEGLAHTVPFVAAMPILAQSICWLVFFVRATIWQSVFFGLPVWTLANCIQH